MNIKLELTLEEVNLILSALTEMPYKIYAAVIAKIKEQGDEQFEAAKKRGFAVMPEGSGHGV